MTAPGSVIAGDFITYTLAISNTGPSDARGVVLQDDFPAGTSYISTSLPCSVQGHRLTCTQGLVAANNHTNVTIPSVPADSADLQITKHDLSDPIRAGQMLTYTITISNTGPAIATGVIVTDTLPVSAALSSISTSQGNCAGIICTLGTISASSRAVITMTVNVYPTVTGVITNTARVSANEADPVAGNNNALETTTILNETADLRISKHDLIDPVRAGEALTYISRSATWDRPTPRA